MRSLFFSSHCGGNDPERWLSIRYNFGARIPENERRKRKVPSKTTAPRAGAATDAEHLPARFAAPGRRELVLEKTVRGSGDDIAISAVALRTCDLVRTEPQLTPRCARAFLSRGILGWNRSPRTRIGFAAISAIAPDFSVAFAAKAAILDVGCGLGFFLRALDPKRWDRYGVEPMPVPYREAANALGSDRVLNAELDRGRDCRPANSTSSLSGIRSSICPIRAPILQEARRLLQPGGLVLIGLPNFDSYQARHFGEDWYGLSLPHHLCHYTRGTLTRLLEACGFRVRLVENRKGLENYHALKHSLLNRMTRLHGSRGGRLRYYALKPFLHPWDWISSLYGGGSSLQVCAEAIPPEAAGRGM